MPQTIDRDIPLTRLGRAVRATQPVPPPEQHRKTNWLRDVILGGQDGLVNMLGSRSA